MSTQFVNLLRTFVAKIKGSRLGRMLGISSAQPSATDSVTDKGAAAAAAELSKPDKHTISSGTRFALLAQRLSRWWLAEPLRIGSLVVVLIFFLFMIFALIVMQCSPRFSSTTPALTPEGKKLIGSWFTPKSDPLAPGLFFQRSDNEKHSYEEALQQSLPEARKSLDTLRAKNDADMKKFFDAAR